MWISIKEGDAVVKGIDKVPNLTFTCALASHIISFQRLRPPLSLFPSLPRRQQGVSREAVLFLISPGHPQRRR